MPDQSSANARIMVVDDIPENLTLLHDMLRAEGYQVVLFPSGEMALKAAAKQPPDLVLLDINMPGLNGFEVCRRLKAQPELAGIPVIFLSALNEPLDKLQAFQCGGVDYVTKPFEVEELRARVRTHLALRKLQWELHERNLSLECLVAERTQELAQALARLRCLDQIKSDFLDMISHEMRTPLSGILGIAELAFELTPESAERHELRGIYQESRSRMDRLLEDAGMLNRLEADREQLPLARIPIATILQEAQRDASAITVRADLGFDLAAVWVLGEPALLRRALATLMQVAACFTRDRNTACLSGTAQDKQVHLHFGLDNLLLSDGQAASFFDLASTARSSSFAEQLGLAPVVAERIISLFGGDVHLIQQTSLTGSLQVVLPRTE